MFEKQLGKLFVLLVCALCIGSAAAAIERYDYDPLGRLVRMIDGANKATDYVYDAAGNLLEVRVGANVTPPVVSSVTPAALRRGETKPVTITGTGFSNTTVAAADAGLDIGNLQITATQIKFDLTASSTATVGTQSIAITSSAGSATANITVAPLLPKVHVDPAPLAIPPDGVSRQFTVRLSHVDVLDHVITLSASNTNIVVTPASIAIPAGQLSVPANIKGVTGGQATINLSSISLGNSAVPVFITSEFVGVTTSNAPIVGIVLEGSTLPPPQQQISLASNQLIGVLVGGGLSSVSPTNFNVGASSATLTIRGTRLETAQTVTVEPSAGITLGAPSVASDGTSITVPITVAADAAVSPRRLLVKNAAGVVFPAADPLADRINIVRHAPQIESVEPLFGMSGTTFMLTIRGRDLHEAQTVTFSPSTGVTTDASPTVNSTGTVLTTRVALGLNAVLGDYAVRVTTPGGTSPTLAGPSNTFMVVNEIQESVTPIIAPIVGVVLTDPNAPVGTTSSLTSTTVGIAFGPVATRISPAIGIVGESVTVTIEGSELNSVTAVQLVPDTGLNIGSAVVASDGKSVTVPIAVAIDAAQTMRKLRVIAGTTEIPFASADASQFRVSLPLPELDSVTPITLQTGQATIPLTVRGRNFQNASQVRVTPADGMTISTPPTINSNGTEITVNISAAANAATGARRVTVVTPAGESSTTLGVTNTITLTNNAGSTYTPIVAPMVGLVKLDGTTPSSEKVDALASPLLGLVLQSEPTPPPAQTMAEYTGTVGVAFGTTALSLDANGFAPGFNGSLVIQGHELNVVTTVSVVPATGITLGAPAVTADGKRVSVPLIVDTAAPRGWRTLKLSTATGNVQFADPTVGTLRVGPGTPVIDSITPILAKQGDVVSMTIRGSAFHDATEVAATPATGITFIPGTLAVNATGTEVTVKFIVNENAPLGSRIIQVLVPGAASNAEPLPANTFTVFPP